MKKLGIFICAITLSTAAFSQVETAEKKEVKIEREVKVTEEAGVKKVEVTTLQANGEARYEVFTGAAAEKKLAEIKKEETKSNAKITRTSSKKKVMKRVEVQTEEKPGEVH